jgi:hypothetical protein
MNGYAILQPRGTQDAGVWSLIEQAEPGQWRITARGSQDDLQRLAGKLNGDTLRTNLEAVREQLANPLPAGAISYDEVMRWNRDEYLKRRARLWVDSNGRDYRDGSETGRPYTTPAAGVMAGRREAHPSFMPAAPDPLTIAARDLAETWNRAGEKKRSMQAQDTICNDWPELQSAINRIQIALGKQP